MTTVLMAVSGSDRTVVGSPHRHPCPSAVPLVVSGPMPASWDDFVRGKDERKTLRYRRSSSRHQTHTQVNIGPHQWKSAGIRYHNLIGSFHVSPPHARKLSLRPPAATPLPPRFGFSILQGSAAPNIWLARLPTRGENLPDRGPARSRRGIGGSEHTLCQKSIKSKMRKA